MRRLEAEFEILEPITTAIRDRTRKEAVDAGLVLAGAWRLAEALELADAT